MCGDARRRSARARRRVGGDHRRTDRSGRQRRRTRGDGGDRCHRLPRDAGADQRPPSPLPEPHPGLPADDRQAIVRMVDVALPVVGGARHRVGVRVDMGRIGRAGALRLHDVDRSSLRAPSRCRRPAHRRGRGRPSARAAVPSHARVDVALAEGRRPAARRRGQRRRLDPRRQRGGGAPPPRPCVGGDDAHRPRSVLPVQCHRSVDGEHRRARRAARRSSPHPLRRERRGRRVQRAHLRLPPHRVPRANRMGRRPHLGRPLRDARPGRDRAGSARQASASPIARRAT